METKPICIYHHPCQDGFASAWVVRKYYGEENVEFVKGSYQGDYPDVTGRDIIFVDFSCKRPVLEDMLEKANSILILDHHKSAREDLGNIRHHKLYSIFDMQKSGVGVTWTYFYGSDPMPQVLEHVQDRDLWKFEIKYTREVSASLFSHDYDFKLWDDLIEGEGQVQLLVDGQAIERKHHKDIKELLEFGLTTRNIAGYDVPTINLPYTMASDAGNIMCKGHPFSAIYYDTEKYRVYSLRSDENGLDVSQIAAKYGGGGHKHAAGFKVNINKPTI